VGWTTRVCFLAGAGIFLFVNMSRPALVYTLLPLQSALSLQVKWPGHEADHSPPYSAKVTNVWSCTCNSSVVFIAWYFIKHSDTFSWYGTSLGMGTSLLFTKPCHQIWICWRSIKVCLNIRKICMYIHMYIPWMQK
jgi:hypothetical protein